MKYEVLLFYKYTTITDPKALMERERAVCTLLGLTGRIIIAEEGINGTLEGTVEATEKYKAHILSDKRFRSMSIKTSEGTGSAFPRLMIKVRNEIVGTQFPKSIDPRKKTGKYLPPHELKRWYDEGKDFVVVDMRNEYEIASGYFDKTVNPGLRASRNLVQAVERLRIHQDKTVVTVCTGGVRCEKMSAYLIDQGFKDVHQLHNGMHGFMEMYPGQHFKGTLFTFDNRIVMDFGGDREIVGKCFSCAGTTEEYQNCEDIMCGSKLLICKECRDSDKKFFCANCVVEAK